MLPRLIAAALFALIVVHARAQSIYAIDQSGGSIGFSVSQLGLFDTEGTFQVFRGVLVLDLVNPTDSRISVDVEAGSAAMASADALGMLRSPAYFDPARFPRIRFTSHAVRQVAADRFMIDGDLEIRDITRPQSFDAKLLGRHRDLAAGGEVADFIVSGRLMRSAFGMVADQNFISDTVTLRIRMRLLLDKPAHAG